MIANKITSHKIVAKIYSPSAKHNAQHNVNVVMLIYKQIQVINCLVQTFAALISSSAKHSAIVLMLRNDASRAPVVSKLMAWLTRRSGDTSTACLRTVPARPILVESSRGPLFITAVTTTCSGF